MASLQKPQSPGLVAASELFQLLRDGAPRTRAELSSITGMARSTIALRLDTLLELDLISPTGEGASSGGRPPSQFALNPSARVVIGADLGATHATLAVTDLGGNILHTHRSPARIADGPEAVLRWFVDAARTTTHCHRDLPIGHLRIVEEATEQFAALGVVASGEPAQHAAECRARHAVSAAIIVIGRGFEGCTVVGRHRSPTIEFVVGFHTRSRTRATDTAPEEMPRIGGTRSDAQKSSEICGQSGSSTGPPSPSPAVTEWLPSVV